jgi:hypothetical protein
MRKGLLWFMVSEALGLRRGMTSLAMGVNHLTSTIKRCGLAEWIKNKIQLFAGHEKLTSLAKIPQRLNEKVWKMVF